MGFDWIFMGIRNLISEFIDAVWCRRVEYHGSNIPFVREPGGCNSGCISTYNWNCTPQEWAGHVIKTGETAKTIVKYWNYWIVKSQLYYYIVILDCFDRQKWWERLTSEALAPQRSGMKSHMKCWCDGFLPLQVPISRYCSHWNLYFSSGFSPKLVIFGDFSVACSWRANFGSTHPWAIRNSALVIARIPCEHRWHFGAIACRWSLRKTHRGQVLLAISIQAFFKNPTFSAISKLCCWATSGVIKHG